MYKEKLIFVVISIIYIIQGEIHMDSKVFEDQVTLKLYSDMKKSGRKLDKSMLSKELLTELWAGDLASDLQIASVFDCSASDVHRLRDGYGINHKTCIKKYASCFFSYFGQAGEIIITN